jgi:hypothetical protein
MNTAQATHLEHRPDPAITGEPDRWSEATAIALMPGDGDPAAERRRRAKQLAALAAGDRQQLEVLRAGLQTRLRRRSDDFAATEGLRTVELALSMTPRGETPRDGQHDKRRRRWWRR